MKKGVKRLAVATVVLGTALIGAQGAAQASFEQCDPTHVCGWGNNDYQFRPGSDGGSQSWEG